MNGPRKPPRVVLVTRSTWYECLLATHGTHSQAEFFLRVRDESIEPVFEQHGQFLAARSAVLQAIPVEWRRSQIARDDLDRFLFEPDDIVVAIGQDGLIANTAKYLRGQFLLGVNPSPAHFPGVLVRLRPDEVGELLRAAAADRAPHEHRTMAIAETDDGQTVRALNEIFIGHASHQSAKYVLERAGSLESQSSSGVIVATGTGATGWAASIHRERRDAPALPGGAERRLVYFAREAWPSATTGTLMTAGILDGDDELRMTSRMNEGGVVFGDGIEGDRIPFDWGRRLAVRIAPDTLRLVTR
ncbi:MAG: hypothetical protein FJ297_05625 [Planctomycetes bacterium]|nr:hypothetical protein [Planctomycetota bacterium]